MAAGLVTFIHDSTETTSAAFVVNVEDGNEDGSAPVNSTFNFSVTPVNDAPTNSGLAEQNLVEGISVYTIDLKTIFSDAETAGHLMTYSVQGNDNVLITIDNLGIATITSGNGWNGTESITFIATDENGLSSTFSTDFIVSPAPFFPPETPGTEVPEDESNNNENTTTIDIAPDAEPERDYGQDQSNTGQPTDSSDTTLDLDDFLSDQTRIVDGIIALREVNDTYLGYVANSDDLSSTSGADWLRKEFIDRQNRDLTVTRPFEDTEFYQGNEWLWHRMNDSDQNLRKDQDNEEMVDQVAKTVGGLSMAIAGLWLGRAAAFGSSIFAVIPAWRSLDPIAVLNKKKKPKSDKKDDEDDNHVEEMFSKKR